MRRNIIISTQHAASTKKEASHRKAPSNPYINIKLYNTSTIKKANIKKHKKILAMTYSPTKRIRSTIGAGGLNFCVRNGYRCDPSAIITRIFLFTLFYFLRNHIPTVPSKLLNV